MSTPSHTDPASADATPRQRSGGEASAPAKSGEGAQSALAAMKRRMQADATHESRPDAGQPAQA